MEQATAVEVQKPVVERKVEQLGAQNIKPAEFIRAQHAATIPIGTNAEDLLDPAYWAHVASQLKPWDRIEARAVDGTWFAEYLVLDVGRTFAQIHLLSKHNLTSQDVALTKINDMSPFEIRWRGPRLWSVVRKADDAVMAEGMTKDAAIEWITKSMK